MARKGKLGHADTAHKEKEGMTVQEAGQIGGQIGGQITREKYGTEFYQEIGHKGGETTSLVHGPDFYHEIGKKGGQRVKELIDKGKQNED